MNTAERRCLLRRSIDFYFRHLDTILHNHWKWAGVALCMIIIINKLIKG